MSKSLRECLVSLNSDIYAQLAYELKEDGYIEYHIHIKLIRCNLDKGIDRTAQQLDFGVLRAPKDWSDRDFASRDRFVMKSLMRTIPWDTNYYDFCDKEGMAKDSLLSVDEYMTWLRNMSKLKLMFTPEEIDEIRASLVGDNKPLEADENA